MVGNVVSMVLDASPFEPLQRLASSIYEEAMAAYFSV
jgi:hypothetical protein